MYMILPDEIIEGLRQRLENHDHDQWEIGRYIVDVVDEIGPHFAKEFDPDDAEKAARKARTEIIRQLADGTGADRSTLRDREVMARFFPREVQEEYEILTYHQMRACKSAGADIWRKWADWAIEWADTHGGKTAPVHHIREAIKQNGDAGEYLWMLRIKRIRGTTILMLRDNHTPQEVRDSANLIRLMCEDVLDGFEQDY